MCERLQPYVSRLLRLDNNPLIQPLPKPAADNDPVGDDVLTLTRALALTLTLTLTKARLPRRPCSTCSASAARS